MLVMQPFQKQIESARQLLKRMLYRILARQAAFFNGRTKQSYALWIVIRHDMQCIFYCL